MVRLQVDTFGAAADKRIFPAYDPLLLYAITWSIVLLLQYKTFKT